MYPVEVTDPEGAPLDWRKSVGLNVDGIGVAPELHGTVFLGEREDEYLPAVHVRLEFHFGDGRYHAVFIGYEAPEVDGTDLRSIRVNEMVQLVASHGIFVKMDPEEPPASLAEMFGSDGMPSYTHGDMQRKVKEVGPNGWVLAQVVFTYQLALVASQPPVKAVQKAFGLTERTAARWIAKAREQGRMIRPEVPGYEGLAELGDLLREKIARGEKLVHEVTIDDLDRGEADGERKAEG